jgi:hypothetical protein
MRLSPQAWRRIVSVGAGVALIGGGLAWWTYTRRPAAARPAAQERPRPVVPEGTRITVEVINSTRTRGLARRATLYLRDLGFDVVRFTTDTARRDSTLVVDRSGHPEWAELVGRALGGARVETRLDSSRYLDVSVFVGASWRPPAQPFHP